MNKSKTKKDTAPLFVPRHLDIKTHEHKGVKVAVEINFDTQKISLVEFVSRDTGCIDPQKKWRAKDWNFSGRELEYMQGWQDVFDAMKNATKLATEELSGYLKLKQSYDIFIEAIHDEKMFSQMSCVGKALKDIGEKKIKPIKR